MVATMKSFVSNNNNETTTKKCICCCMVLSGLSKLSSKLGMCEKCLKSDPKAWNAICNDNKNVKKLITELSKEARVGRYTKVLNIASKLKGKYNILASNIAESCRSSIKTNIRALTVTEVRAEFDFELKGVRGGWGVEINEKDLFIVTNLPWPSNFVEQKIMDSNPLIVDFNEYFRAKWQPTCRRWISHLRVSFIYGRGTFKELWDVLLEFYPNEWIILGEDIFNVPSKSSVKNYKIFEDTLNNAFNKKSKIKIDEDTKAKQAKAIENLKASKIKPVVSISKPVVPVVPVVSISKPVVSISKPRWKTFEEARDIVRKLKLSDIKEWWEWSKSKRPKDIPSTPSVVYKDDWISFPDFLGTKDRVRNASKFKTFEEARDVVRKLGLSSIKEWKRWSKSKRPSDIPSNPDQIYKDDWVSFPDFLGYIKRGNKGTKPSKPRWKTFEEARDIVRKLKLSDIKEWWEWSKSKRPKDIPSRPDLAYKDDWVSFPDFLGTKDRVRKPSKFKTFEDAKDLVIKQKFGSIKEYKKWSKSGKRPSDIPSNPDQTYRYDWVSWSDFLGYRKKTVVTRIKTIEPVVKKELVKVVKEPMKASEFDRIVKEEAEALNAKKELEENKLKSEKVKAGLAKAKEDGVKLGRPQAEFDVNEALELKRSGMSWSQLSKKMGVSSATLRRVMYPLFNSDEEKSEKVKEGMERAKEKGVHVGRPKIEIDIIEVLRLKNEGLGVRKIAKKLGVSSSSVHRALSEKVMESSVGKILCDKQEELQEAQEELQELKKPKKKGWFSRLWNSIKVIIKVVAEEWRKDV